ncbi:hypothetical protein [Saliphagus infecundisoli]|uniref:Uncharacterized protein n=1 Tax=Saliphagus infecundisoli TaxID=1849069 RepID=A0ABD5Q9F4_9EURY|nr:hypothetical protein [Saliphagus infecundisoli]
MVHSQQRRSGVPSTWGELNSSAVELLFAVTLLLGSVSVAVMASGDPELMAVVALSGVTVVLFGMALVRLSEYLRTTELSLF